MKALYPEIEPFTWFYLPTASQHQVYVEQSGNVNGIPVIFLHGGPCSGTRPDHRRFFNPEKYHIILMDQRGCGQSLPFGEVENNTTQDLMEDMENIRKQLKISQWLLFGGSWGSTLALLYGQQYRQNVSGMVLRGTFLARQVDMDWYAKENGVARVYPEMWQPLQASAIELDSLGLVKGLHKAVFGQDELARRRAASAWINWGGQLVLMEQYQQPEKPYHVTEKMVHQVQMEMHYALNQYFIAENQIINQSLVLRDIPTIILHGRRDLVCPIESSLSLSKALPNAEFIVIENATHIANSEEMIDALVDATDRMQELIQ